MPRRRQGDEASETTVAAYRYDDVRRTNVPPAALAAQGRVREVPRLQFGYDPHRPPTLRFDQTGAADQIKEILAASRTRPLTAEESRLLSEALQQHEPWLEWAGKREQKQFEVDPVALHLHERVSAQAILQVAAHQPVQRSLFADPELTYRQAIQFYQHDVDWANRLILGDSLQVMASLARRENLAGQVQMIYLDPPYGIRFGSNFQPEVGRREVKDTANDLTREPEMVKAYRDTWTLGVHSYLSYLRDRLVLARELLADSGSIFVQIGDDNPHRLRAVMDEVFGEASFVVTFPIKKKGSQRSGMIDPVNDYLLWYTKTPREENRSKFRRVQVKRAVDSEDISEFSLVELRNGGLFSIGALPLPNGKVEDFRGRESEITSYYPDARICRSNPLTSGGHRKNQSLPFEYQGRIFNPGDGNCWKTRVVTDDGTTPGMSLLAQSERLIAGKGQLRFKSYLDDFGYVPLSNWWDGLGGAPSPIYVVQTNPEIIERCLLMTTDPGDLVLDPTCGSGTTAYVAEQWGRRWITIDTSRVALALARQRLLTGTFSQYRTRDEQVPVRDGNRSWANPGQGFVYKTVPHVTLGAIANNQALDHVFERHRPVVATSLAALNAALGQVPPELRQRLSAKLASKQKREGRRSITEADRRRWLLPREPWREWEVPFDTDEEWPETLSEALHAFRDAWRVKMDEVNAAIAAGTEQEELVDQPEIVRGVVRVSGPFTVEAVMPAEQSLDAEEESPIGGAPDGLETFDPDAAVATDSTNAEAYLDRMLRLLKLDGVRFPNNRVASFTRLDPLQGGDYIQAEGEWETDTGETVRVAVSFGPEHGPVTSYQVENAIRMAYRRSYDDLVFAGFSFDAAAQAAVQEDADDPSSRVRCHLAHIRPDVQMAGLLKETPSAQLFTVFGSPRTELHRQQDGEYAVEMQGVDIYNPVENTILPTSADKVAAWFLDADYDGQTFCITQAFFPDRSAWDRLARALKGVIDEEAFAALSGTTSLPFPIGPHKRVAVKVIDPRGNEVMRVHRLEGVGYEGRAHA